MLSGVLALRDREYGLDKLVEVANGLLAAYGDEPADGRVAGRLDARTVRYYGTRGLLPAPLRYDGRRAVYGYPHLLHLLLIKALQTQGWPLAQIRTWLADRSQQELEAALASIEGPQQAIARPDTPPADLARPHAFHPSGIPQARPQAASSALRAFKLADGVRVVIDADVVERAEQLAAELRRFLQYWLADVQQSSEGSDAAAGDRNGEV